MLKVAPVFRQMLDYKLQIQALAIEHLFAIIKIQVGKWRFYVKYMAIE